MMVRKEREKEEKEEEARRGEGGWGRRGAPRCEAAKIEYGIRDPYPIGDRSFRGLKTVIWHNLAKPQRTVINDSGRDRESGGRMSSGRATVLPS